MKTLHIAAVGLLALTVSGIALAVQPATGSVQVPPSTIAKLARTELKAPGSELATAVATLHLDKATVRTDTVHLVGKPVDGFVGPGDGTVSQNFRATVKGSNGSAVVTGTYGAGGLPGMLPRILNVRVKQEK